jgi:hypothetical protein
LFEPTGLQNASQARIQPGKFVSIRQTFRAAGQVLLQHRLLARLQEAIGGIL